MTTQTPTRPAGPDVPAKPEPKPDLPLFRLLDGLPLPPGAEGPLVAAVRERNIHDRKDVPYTALTCHYVNPAVKSERYPVGTPLHDIVWQKPAGERFVPLYDDEDFARRLFQLGGEPDGWEHPTGRFTLVEHRLILMGVREDAWPNPEKGGKG